MGTAAAASSVCWSVRPLQSPLPPPPLTSSFCFSSPGLSISPTNSNTAATTTTTATTTRTTKTLSLIQNSGVIACLRANSAEVAFRAASAALNAGISVLEITMSTPGVLQILAQLVGDHPTVALGVGTVLNTGDAVNAVNAGAKFLMSPAVVKGILDDVQNDEVLYIPGVMTPTEILSAHDAGAKILKVYPVSALGGTKYISAIKKPFQHIPLVASQGITIESIGDYISCGASAVVLSDAIFSKEAMTQNDFDVIYQLARIAALRGEEAVQR